MLKSPTKIKFTFEVVWCLSNDLNSAQKAEIDDDEGRYIVKILTEKVDNETEEPIHSNVE